MIELNGKRIQDLPAADTVKPGDLVVAAVPVNEESGAYYSAAAYLSSFIEECALNCAAFEFGSAARMNSADFSPADHRHDSLYNRLSIEQQEFGQQNLVSVGNFQDAGGVYRPLMAPLQSVPPIMAKPEIGTLKFMALAGLTSAIDENSQDFDGWCWADGRSLNVAEWRDAFETFGYSYSSAKNGYTFQIPNFERFIRPIPNGYQSGSQYDVQPYDVYIPDHSHNANISLTGDVKIEMQLSVVRNAYGAGNALHAGGYSGGVLKTFNNDENKINIDVETINIDGKVLSSGTDDEEAYPSHVNIPVLIYIGFKNSHGTRI